MMRGSRDRPKSGGFALILALFLLVSLTAIGTYLYTVSMAQLEAGVQDEQGARAYQAALAGIDWGAFQLLRNSAGPFASTCAGGSASQSFNLTAGLSGFRAEVQCTKVGQETEGTSTVRVFRLTSTGCNRAAGCAGTPDATYVERRLQLTVTTN